MQADDPNRRRFDSGTSDYSGEQHWRVANMGDANWPARSELGDFGVILAFSRKYWKVPGTYLCN
ncbi:protein of unknown function (plasmid) [Cupriavidus taiwanensis]|uniref:Uncharacterized protein n=1 Tax=Cupriavidus taiwanensis TaxID=164546 RepID=A0A375ISV2_9BURK|nr:protein of unknown function [Cupriavidus taiwanensis]